MSLTDIEKVQRLATKALEQVKQLKDEQAVSFLMGLIAQVYREGAASSSEITIENTEAVYTGDKKHLH